MTLYKIAGWDRHFEARDTRRVDGPLRWIAIPTKTDGFGFSRLRMERDRAELLAAWYLLVGIAAKQPKKHRGEIGRDGIPLSSDDLELMTGFPARIFNRAFSFFSEKAQGWLVAEKTSTDCPPMPQTCAPTVPTGQDRTGQDMQGVAVGTAHRRAAGAAPASDAEWLADLQANPAYRGLSVQQEFAKLQAWCGANKKQATRRRFVNWLNRADKPMQVRAEVARKPADQPPANWQATLRRLYPDARTDITWGELPDPIRAKVRAG